jgi:transposase-like protein
VPAIPRDEATDLYLREGWSIGRLARSYGTSRATLRNHLLAWNVPLRSRAEQLRLDMEGRHERHAAGPHA